MLWIARFFGCFQGTSANELATSTTASTTKGSRRKKVNMNAVKISHIFAVFTI